MSTCTILIKDEVNCKLVGLDLPLRQKLVKQFKVEVPHARHLPSFKLGRWDGKIAFVQLGGNTFINMLEDILPILMAEGYDIQLDDRRNYNSHFNFPTVDENTFKHITWPEGHRFEGEPIKLNDHQVVAINNYLQNPQCMQEIATGAGKTIITAALSLFAEAYGRSIIIVPNKSLVTQTEEDYINMGLDVGVYYGNRKEWNKTHTICTWQSLNQLFKDSTNGKASLTFDDFIDDVGCVIVDEVHSAKADALKAMLSGPMAHIPLRWGLTGTVPKEKFERMTIECTIGKVIGQVSAAELQKLGILASCHVHIKQLQDNRDLGNYQSELKYLLSDGDRLDHIAEMIISMSLTGNTLVLVDRVGAANELALRLPPDRVSVVTGKVKVTKRKEEYDEIAEVDDKIIVATYGVAAVGLNIPRIFNLVLIEPGKSFVRVIQSIGRSLRVADDKDYADIYDITSNCKFAKRHLTKRKQFYREAEYKFSIEKIHWKK
jgi:superfamily II DNA or RNA helicase